MATYTIKTPQGDSFDVTAPEGATQEEVLAYAKNNKPEPFGQRIKREVESIPRQVGLTARSALQGTAGMAGVFSNPIGYLQQKITGDPVIPAYDLGGIVADKIGLPTPETATERIVGRAVEFAAPMGGQAAGAKALSGLLAPQTATRGLLESLAVRPGAQVVGGATGGGAAEGAAELGLGPGYQFGASLLGGFGGTAATIGAGKIASSLQGVVNSIRGTQANISGIEQKLDQMLKANGYEMAELPLGIRNDLVKEVERAAVTGDSINPDVIRRLADYSMVGARPTQGSVTLDPVLLTQERNTAKMGANSSDPVLQQLARNQRENDMILTENLNRLGAGEALEPVAAGETLLKALKGVDAPRKAQVDAAYKDVRDSYGRYAEVDVDTFQQRLNASMEESQLWDAVPSTVQKRLDKVFSGETPLNVSTMITLDKRLSGARSDALRTGDKEGALAISKVLDELRTSDIKGSAGQTAGRRYDKARSLAADRFKKIEENPAMQAMLDNQYPDKFVKTYLTGAGGKANVRDVTALARDLKQFPGMMEQARSQIIGYLKNSALSGKADEVGNFSPHAFNKAMDALGDRKLSIFFNGSELSRLKAIGRVASYEKFQPTGAAINNSNTAGGVYNILEKIARSKFMQRVPMVGDASANFGAQSGAQEAFNPLRVITSPGAAEPFPLAPMVIPGLLSAE